MVAVVWSSRVVLVRTSIRYASMHGMRSHTVGTYTLRVWGRPDFGVAPKSVAQRNQSHNAKLREFGSPYMGQNACISSFLAVGWC